MGIPTTKFAMIKPNYGEAGWHVALNNALDTQDKYTSVPVTYVIAAGDSATPLRGDADFLCDGVDDNVQIQAAIDAIRTGPGQGAIVLLEGNYILSSSIVVDGLDLLIRGVGAVQTTHVIKPSVELNAPLILMTEVHGNTILTLEQLSFDGAGTTATPAVWFNDAHDLHISSCIFWRNAAINLGQSVTSGSGNIWITNCWLENCTAVAAIRILSSTHTKIDSCYFLNNAPGVYIEKAGHYILGNRIHIRGCTFLEQYTHGIHAKNCAESGLIIADNNILASGGSAANTYDAIFLEGVRHALIVNNKMYNRGAANDQRYGVHMDDGTYGHCGHVLIEGNDFLGSGIDAGRNPAYKEPPELPYGYAGNLSGNIHRAAGNENAMEMRGRAEIFQDCLVLTTDHVRNNEDLSAGIPITFTIDAQPDVPRTITWVFNAHAQITAYTMEIQGFDAKGRVVFEEWDETAGWTGETNNAFATITHIRMTARTGTGVGDTMDVGIASKLGLADVIYGTEDVIKVKKNAADYPAASYTVDATYHTVDVSTGAPIGAADDFTVWYRTSLNMV